MINVSMWLKEFVQLNDLIEIIDHNAYFSARWESDEVRKVLFRFHFQNCE
jgi:hypothetical protein